MEEEEEDQLKVWECLVECSPTGFLSSLNIISNYSQIFPWHDIDPRWGLLEDLTDWRLDSCEGCGLENRWRCRYLDPGHLFSLLGTGRFHCYHKIGQTLSEYRLQSAAKAHTAYPCSFTAWRKDFRHCHRRNKNKTEPSQIKMEKPILQEARRNIPEPPLILKAMGHFLVIRRSLDGKVLLLSANNWLTTWVEKATKVFLLGIRTTRTKMTLILVLKR